MRANWGLASLPGRSNLLLALEVQSRGPDDPSSDPASFCRLDIPTDGLFGFFIVDAVTYRSSVLGLLTMERARLAAYSCTAVFQAGLMQMSMVD